MKQALFSESLAVLGVRELVKVKARSKEFEMLPNPSRMEQSLLDLARVPFCKDNYYIVKYSKPDGGGADGYCHRRMSHTSQTL